MTNSPENIAHWLDGHRFTGSSKAHAEVTNPATGAVTGKVALASNDDAAAVIASSAAAAPAWAAMSLTKRIQVMYSFRELLNSRKDELAAIITSQHGKALSDAHGEVSRGLEVVEFACGAPIYSRARIQNRYPRASTSTMSISHLESSVSSAPSTFPRWFPCGFSRSRSQLAMR